MVNDLNMELQVSGGDHTVTPQEGARLAVVVFPVALDDADGIEDLAVPPVDAPHPNQGLELDHRSLSVRVVNQRFPPLLLQIPPECQPPPALDDPGSEGCVEQGPAHQCATPPGLDLNGCFDFGLFKLFLDRDKRDYSRTFLLPTFRVSLEGLWTLLTLALPWRVLGSSRTLIRSQETW